LRDGPNRARETLRDGDDALPDGGVRSGRVQRVRQLPFRGGDAASLGGHDAFNQQLQQDGYWVFADGLAPATTATVVDGQGAETVITDGPYLEAKEYLGGFWIIEAPDLDVALRLAAEGSKACRGKVEVRPFGGL
jgi:hypothetical protein